MYKNYDKVIINLFLVILHPSAAICVILFPQGGDLAEAGQAQVQDESLWHSLCGPVGKRKYERPLKMEMAGSSKMLLGNYMTT